MTAYLNWRSVPPGRRRSRSPNRGASPSLAKETDDGSWYRCRKPLADLEALGLIEIGVHGICLDALRGKNCDGLGALATIAELTEREGIAPSYMTRVLRLTLLAPDIVDVILDGRQEPEVTLARLLEPFPMDWRQQLERFG